MYMLTQRKKQESPVGGRSAGVHRAHGADHDARGQAPLLIYLLQHVTVYIGSRSIL